MPSIGARRAARAVGLLCAFRGHNGDGSPTQSSEDPHRDPLACREFSCSPWFWRRRFRRLDRKRQTKPPCIHAGVSRQGPNMNHYRKRGVLLLLVAVVPIGIRNADGASTTAQVPWPYFARAAAARRDVACGGLRPLDDCAPDANGTTTGSRPRPTRVPPTGNPDTHQTRRPCVKPTGIVGV
jgi:hypothetical protein